ncbi:LOG family protein [Candidatus Uhrbacteria bacterium]|nr:LOG family protein [Candidatus Uhrbacteria bacterium]
MSTLPQSVPEPFEKSYLKYKICVSGSADTTFCGPDTYEKTKEIGKHIVTHNGILVTGATTGVPYWAAIGAKEAGGISIGISPAASELAHVKSYKLPTDYFDLIMYTGFDYSGRNLLLVRSADAVIEVCGRMGTLNEFTIAFEDKKPIGILEGCGGISEEIRHIIKLAHKGEGKVVYDTDPKALVERLIEIIDKEKGAPLPKEDYLHAKRKG